jgi:large subunit ribosomal protein L16
MFFPKKVKHRKWQRARKNPNKITADTRGIKLENGSFGLKAVTAKRVNSQQIEAARRTMVHYLGKTAKVWIRIFPDRPYTKKPSEVKMGKGKGDVQGYEFEVLPGRILFEVDGASEEASREALRKAGTKLPLKSKIVAK